MPTVAAWVIDVIIATTLLCLVLAIIAHSGVIETFSGGRGLLVAVAYILIQVTLRPGLFRGADGDVRHDARQDGDGDEGG
ncbi:MAG: hypothetical protein OXL97_06995 [Chloroflexota bacterium]|nr:hypothetical protein [Chloroflexota bacterium]MDE2885703.1 hypothetical protein [Chloroflexota bacterium]